MIVDVHAHYFPKDYNAMLMRIGGRSLPEAARPPTARPMREDDASSILTRLPLPHIDAALREMERGLDRLGMLGVSMTCS
jgi:hypothetical protein